MVQFYWRRTAVVSLFTCAAGLFYVMFLTQIFKSKYVFNQLRKQSHEKNTKLSTINTAIVLLSQPRSGSTFLGTFLKSLDERTLDFYEPLQALLRLKEVEKQSTTYKTIAKSFLHQLFHCHFTEDIESTLGKVYNGFFSQSTANKCNKLTLENVNLCREPRAVIFNQLFNTYRTLFVKLLEPRLPCGILSLTPIATTSTFYIIYLVRDPRASFWSLLNKRWVNSRFDNGFKRYVVSRCKEMHENLKELKQKKDESKEDQIIILRHEDILQNPLRMLKILSKFLNKDTPDQSLKNFMLKIRNDTTIGCRTDQNMAWPNWHADAGEEFVDFIERNCEAVMNLTGYKVRDRRERKGSNCNEKLILEKDSVELLNIFNDPYDDDLLLFR